MASENNGREILKGGVSNIENYNKGMESNGINMASENKSLSNAERIKGFAEEGEDFISEDAFQEKVKDQNQEAIKWKDLPTEIIYKILDMVEVDGKFGKSRILTLKDRQGETTRVWACPTLNKEKDALVGAFVRSMGFKLSKKTKQQYLSYDLVRK